MSSHAKLTGKHQYVEFKEETVAKRVQDIKQRRDAMDITDRHIKLSYGNRKTGSLVPSISLAPILDCRNCAACAKGCYAIRNIMCYGASREMVANNSAIAHGDLPRYFSELNAAVKFVRFLRIHVSGDIISPAYLTGMVDVAIKNPHCQFLAFTKCYDFVNDYLDDHAEGFPENLHIIFSEWRGVDVPNPHNLPTSRPVWKGEKVEGIMCPGSCSECAAFNRGCWTLKKGERILFEAH